MSFITAADVRRASGAPTSLISDDLIDQAIALVEVEMERWMNTKFIPTVRIDHMNGNGLVRMFTRKNPLLSVRGLTLNNSTIIDPANIVWNKPSGKITIGKNAGAGSFVPGLNNTYIKYLFGMLDDTSTETTLTIATIAGTSISMTVGSETGFADEDWVEIRGMDGSREVAQITGVPEGTTIIVDQLVKAHESGSEIVLLQIPYFIKRYMEIEAAIYIAIYAIGGTYEFNTSYSLGELSVNKGEPYPQWREVIQRMINERKMRRATIKIRPSIMVD